MTQERDYKPSKRNWVKLWVDEWLSGTTRFELSEKQRSIWIDLIALAGKSRFPGIIASGQYEDSYRGYPLSYLAGSLVYSEVDFIDALNNCEKYGKIRIERHVHDDIENLVIHINNWDKYQSEYLRQRKYNKAEVDGNEEQKKEDVTHNTKEKKENPTSYQYWFDKLLKENSNNPIPMLADAFCALTGSEMPTEKNKRDKLIKRMGALYRDCRNDAFEVLAGIRDLNGRKIEGDKLNYLTAMLHKRQGSE